MAPERAEHEGVWMRECGNAAKVATMQARHCSVRTHRRRLSLQVSQTTEERLMTYTKKQKNVSALCRVPNLPADGGIEKEWEGERKTTQTTCGQHNECSR